MEEWQGKLENLEIRNNFSGIYSNKNILITGHTGFKGSWLALWLINMGANVIGYSQDPPTIPNHYQLLNLDIKSIHGDVRDKNKLERVILKSKPEIIFHLAAQSLVRKSYREPIDTFETNILGTVNLLEASKRSNSIKAIVVVTSDKCYENKESNNGYSETDPLGGYDPYSASKGCAEIITSSYRQSFFNLQNYGKTHQVLIGSCRAGNVIGGGDWAEDRIIPDIVSATVKNRDAIIRNPHSIRPWQHVLDPLSGYLMVGKKLLLGEKEFACAWNFGPSEEENVSVIDLVSQMQINWEKIKYKVDRKYYQPVETSRLILDSSKAFKKLGWKNIWSIPKAIHMTTIWYKTYYDENIILTQSQLNEYLNL